MTRPSTDLADGAVAIWAPAAISQVAAIITRQAGSRRIYVVDSSKELFDLLERVELRAILVDEAVEGPPDFLIATKLSAMTDAEPKPAVLLMATAPTRKLVVHAQSVGIAGVLAKPFSARQFLTAMGRGKGAKPPISQLAKPALLD